MTELERRTQQAYDGLYNYVTRGIPDEYMDLVEKNLKRFCVMMVKNKVEINSKDDSYIKSIDIYNEMFDMQDVESRLMFFGKNEHWDNLLKICSTLFCMYEKNKKSIFHQERLPFRKCKQCFSYVLEEAYACPFYVRNEVLEEINIIWETLLSVASLSGCLYCVYIWFKFPKGPMRYKCRTSFY